MILPSSEYVSSAKAASATLIDEVMKPYSKDAAKTVASLLNFVIESAGCPNKISNSEVDEEDVEKVIKSKIVTKEYMMVSFKSFKYSKFVSNLKEIIHSFQERMNLRNSSPTLMNFGQNCWVKVQIKLFMMIISWKL